MNQINRMIYIDSNQTRDLGLLEEHNISPALFESVYKKIKKAIVDYYRLSPKHEHYWKILNTSDMLLDQLPAFQNLPLKDKHEWKQIRNLKTGDRGYVNRYLLATLKTACPAVYEELIYPRYLNQIETKSVDVLDLSFEVDTILLLCNIPAFFAFQEQVITYKKSIFNPIRRGYIWFIQEKALHVIASFMKQYETDLNMMESSLLDYRNSRSWEQLLTIITHLGDQCDRNHHDPLSRHAINCLRSIYVSLFNCSMTWLLEKGPVPVEIRKLLPVIPDRLDFSKNGLEYDNFWNRYLDHQFLFMRLPREKRGRLSECLSRLSPPQRVAWMGCLGKQEIRALIMPMVSQTTKFENLTDACKKLIEADTEDMLFAGRVWGVLESIYLEHLVDKESVPKSIHQAFSDNRNKAASHPLKKTEDPIEKSRDISSLKKLSFLVVDDSEKIRGMTIKVLKHAGVVSIHEAADGQQAWQMIQQHPVDVVLCDWLMPNMSGIELAKKIMQIEDLASKTVFLMLTTVNDKAAIVEALSIGVRGYLIKPFTRNQLLEKVLFATEWLQREQQSRDSSPETRTMPNDIP